jgi:hypothetical protein
MDLPRPPIPSAGHGLEFRRFACRGLSPFRASRGFLDFGTDAAGFKVARLAPPEGQLAPASPVFHVALGIRDDRDLFFQDCSSRA